MPSPQRFGPPELLGRVADATAGFSGHFTCYARNLITGEEVGIDAEAEMPTASVIKVPIMVELYRQAEAGEVDLAQRITVEPDHWVGGTGILKDLMPGIAPTLTDLCRVMIVLSDNVATRMLVDLLGKERINQSLREWGFAVTEVRMRMDGWGDIRDYAVSTPRELGRLMAMIAQDELVSTAACAAMRDHLNRQQHVEQLVRGLPYSPYLGEIGIPQALTVGNKIGSYFGMRADVAIVEAPGARFVLAAVNEGSPDIGFGVDQEGSVANGRFAQAVYEAWVSEEAQADARRMLRRGC